MKKTTLAMLILCASLALPAQAGFEEGLAAYERGDYATALKEWQPLAVAGNAVAQHKLGVMYAKGQGVPQDDKEAAKWFRLAAEQGNADAQNDLGWIHDNGRGVPQYYQEAVKWYRKAAEQGHAFAQYNLGVMYERGVGVAQDYKEAMKWYRLSAEQGDADAKNNLGAMYAKGLGVPQDKVLAYALFNVSAAGDPAAEEAISNRDIISKAMTPREIKAGQALTRELAQPGNFGKALDAYLRKAQGGKR